MCQAVQKALDGSSWLCLRIGQEAEQEPCCIIKAKLLKPCFFFGTHYSKVGPRDLCVHRLTRLCQVYAHRGNALTPGESFLGMYSEGLDAHRPPGLHPKLVVFA